MKRELPIVKIEGTDFLVDVQRAALQEKENPGNTISFFEMDDLGDGYRFEYNRAGKNLPDIGDRGTDNVTIVLPQLVEIDPAGMAQKYGYRQEALPGKSDFEVMVDQSALGDRLKGRLTTMDIAGHTFYVDIPMDKLRPKDDFLSHGIGFTDVDHYYSDERKAYIVPYNPGKREFQEIDYDSITAFPKDLIAIEFPHERVLDPVGYNRRHGLDLKDGLKETSISAHFTAKIVDWKDTGIQVAITENLKKLPQEQQQKKVVKSSSRMRRGRGI